MEKGAEQTTGSEQEQLSADPDCIAAAPGCYSTRAGQGSVALPAPAAFPLFLALRVIPVIPAREREETLARNLVVERDARHHDAVVLSQMPA